MTDTGSRTSQGDWRSSYQSEQRRFRLWLFICVGCLCVGALAAYVLSQVAPDWSFLGFVPMLTSFIALGNAAKWLVRASRIQAEVARSSQQHRALPIRILNEHPLGSAAVVVVAVIVVVVALGRH